MKQSRRRQLNGSMWIALGTVLLIALLALATVFEPLELPAQDVLFRLRPPRSTKANIVIIAIDEKTVTAWDEASVVFWGYYFAKILPFLKEANVRGVGVDFHFTSDVDKTIATELIQWRLKPPLPLHELPPMLEPMTTFVRALEDWKGSLVLADQLGQETSTANQMRSYFDASEARLFPAYLQEDSDGIVRGAYLTIGSTSRTAREVIPGFAAQLAKLATPSLDATLQKQTGDVSFGINFVGKEWETAFPTISAQKLLKGNTTPEEETKIKAILRDSIVLIGTTYRDAEDKHRAPGNARCSGVVMQAHAMATLVDGRPLRRASPLTAALFAGTAGLLMIMVARSHLPVRKFGVFVLLILCGLVALGSLLAFRDFLIPIVPTFAGLVLPPTVFYAGQSFEERRSRLRVEQVFGRQVSPAIRDYLMVNSTAFEDQCVEATILFVDICDSTPFGETHTPQETFAALNALFAEVVPIVEANGGLIYRFLGDGFLAVFGTPLPLENHAQAAVNAALMMVHRTRTLSPDIFGGVRRLRYGIHTGEILCGNLGAEDRTEFTVIGDTINLASRLEGINKEKCSDICISEATAHRLTSLGEGWTGPEQQHVRGRTQPLAIYLYRLEA